MTTSLDLEPMNVATLTYMLLISYHMSNQAMCSLTFTYDNIIAPSVQCLTTIHPVRSQYINYEMEDHEKNSSILEH
jgi:hypothetical protein